MKTRTRARLGKPNSIRAIAVVSLWLVTGFGSTNAPASDWYTWRGPARDGHSPERDLPESWSLDGDNLVWSVPFGGRSTPIVVGDRLYLQHTSGEGETLQERLSCFNVDTGALQWERRINIYMSDVPAHRVGWASPVADPATGNLFMFTVGGTLASFAPDGTPRWERSLNETFGLITTHGGRTVSPIVEGELVIVSGLNSGWGEQARGSQRFMAFDKNSGETIWVSSPGGRPYDTTYSPPIATSINGQRLLIAGGGDGAVHALKPQTGEPVWRIEFSKRGVNSGVVIHDNTAFVSHSEENLNSSEMGLLAAIDATATGDIALDSAKWSVGGFLGGFSSPVLDGSRLYQIDNSANLTSFDVASGTQQWKLNLGTMQRASPVLADGKLYMGTVNGKFYIVRPGADSAEILSEVQLGGDSAIEEIYASVAIADGRVYLTSAQNTYAIGPTTRRTHESTPLSTVPEGQPGEPAHLQVVPTELRLQPGSSQQFTARLFDDKGRLIGESEATWSLDGLDGSVSEGGNFNASGDAKGQAGKIVATAMGLSGYARLRVITPLPWSEDFDAMQSIPTHWINATGKFELRELAGEKVLVKKADNPFLRRARVYMGYSDSENYTVSADVLAAEARRQLGNVGVIAQRYELVLMGNHQRLELRPWQPEVQRTVKMPFTWNPDTWYRVMLSVDNLPDGTTRARGKVWPRGQDEPTEWMIEKIDPIPNRSGSPGIYADATPTEVFLDNLEVHENR